MSRYNFEPTPSAVRNQQQFSQVPVQYSGQPSASGPAHSQTFCHEHQTELAQHAFDQNQRAIPGLGLGAAPYGKASSRGATSGENTTLKQHGFCGDIDLNQNPVSDSLDPSSKNVTTEVLLSEGELEDLYEPVAEDERFNVSQPQASNISDDRYGSYSPRMSPEDCDQSQRSSFDGLSVNSSRQDLLDDVTRDHEIAAPGNSSSKPDEIEKARRDAREAILHLWPLKVRYENYLKDGIDQALLQKLFQELGLTLESLTVEQSAPPNGKTLLGVQMASNANSRTTGSGDDGKESRKDRIARLLAAKRTGQKAPAPTTGNTSAATDSKRSQPTSKSADKSKLLYEKMEALRRAREAKAQAILNERQTQNDPSSTPKVAEPSITSSDNAQILRANDASLPSSEKLNGTLSAAPSRLSSPQPNSHATTQKRPVASDFLVQQHEPPVKRPFSQTDRSRRFLIDVSEDEDSDGETAMDIDSPELRPVTLRRIVTEDSGLRTHAPFTDVPSNGRSTPSTGIGRSYTGPGKEDLNKMQQDIEQMKRRIAEAEARKKAKESRQGTPHQTPLSGRSEEASLGSPSSAPAVQDTSKPDVSPTTQPPDAENSPSLSTSPDMRAHSNHRHPELQRSLSRSALERLAIIEAERKRQTLKMKILRAQLAQMEKEMAANLEEEKALRAESSPSPTQDQTPDTTAMCSVPEKTCEGGGQVSRESPPPQSLPVTHSEALQLPRSAENHPQAHTHADDVAMTEVNASPGEEIMKGADEVSHSNLQLPRLPPEPSQTPNHPAVSSEEDDASSQPPSVEEDSAASESDEESSEETDSSQGQSLASSPSPSPTVAIPTAEPGPNESPTFHGRDQATEEPRAVQQAAWSRSTETFPSRGETGLITTKEQDGEIPDEVERVTHSVSPSRLLTTLQVPQSVAKRTSATPAASQSTFQPYESPLQYFHAYRFHPEFSTHVKGGLRSLTYSNKLDVRQQLCPDELLGQECTRGGECDFQHLSKIATPDDQILMQLGSYGAHEGDQQEKFNEGLRNLLTQFRDQKIKDFQTISQAIIDYRTQFHHDKSRILPLGNVSL